MERECEKVTGKSVDEIANFLRAVDEIFPVPLSQKQEITILAEKFCRYGTLCTVEENGKTVAMAAGYTNNELAYLSVLATRPACQGRGYARALVQEFIEKARVQACRAVHLYTASTNLPAIRLYEGLGFVRWVLLDEPRPDDAHLIYYIKK